MLSPRPKAPAAWCKDPAMNQPIIPGEQAPQEGHGGSNVKDTSSKQGKEGNGAQKRQQQKKR